MLTVVATEPVAPRNDTGTYFRLDEALQPVACNGLEWEALQKTGAATAATTHLGSFASVITTFEGVDDSFGEQDDPHLFMTMVCRDEHSEAEGHRSWHDAEAAHRARVDELKILLERMRREQEPQLDL